MKKFILTLVAVLCVSSLSIMATDTFNGLPGDATGTLNLEVVYSDITVTLDAATSTADNEGYTVNPRNSVDGITFVFDLTGEEIIPFVIGATTGWSWDDDSDLTVTGTAPVGGTFGATGTAVITYTFDVAYASGADDGARVGTYTLAIEYY